MVIETANIIDTIDHSLELDDIPLDAIQASEIEEGGAAGPENTRVLYNKTPIFDQDDPKTINITRNACGSAGISKGINEGNAIEGTYESNPLNYIDFRNNTVKDYNGSLKGGSTMMANINNAKDHSWIESAYVCKTVEEVCDALDKGRLVYSGTKRGDRYATIHASDNILRFTDHPKFGHLVMCVGYDKDEKVYLFANSWGERVHDKGIFKVKFSDMGKMFSFMALIDKKDKHIVDKITLDRQLAADAASMGIWNTQRPDEAILYGEFSIMLGRLGIKMVEGVYSTPITRKFVADTVVNAFHISDSSIVRNGSNHDAKCTRYQAMLMIMRAKHQ